MSQNLKMILKITDDENVRYNTLKYNIVIYDYNKDTTYSYITPSMFTLIFEYGNMYKINIGGDNMSEHELYLINHSPVKNQLINLLIPLTSDRKRVVKKMIYYLTNKNRYYVDPI